MAAYPLQRRERARDLVAAGWTQRRVAHRPWRFLWHHRALATTMARGPGPGASGPAPVDHVGLARPMNPRICQVVALPARPNAKRPSGTFSAMWRTFRLRAKSSSSTGPGTTAPVSSGSWGFARTQEYREFMRSCPEFERMLVRAGIQLIKYWFSVSDEEQERRFQEAPDGSDQALEAQPDGPGKPQTLGRLLQGLRTMMFAHTDIKQAPWYVVNSDIKRNTRG